MTQHKQIKSALVLAMGLAITPPLFAIDSFYFNSNLVLPFPDEHRNADADYGFNGIIGAPVTDTLLIEGGFHGNKFILDSGQTEYVQNSFNVDLLWHPIDGNRYSPYFLIGSGWLITKYNANSYSNPLGSIGVGTFYDLGEKDGWLLRGGTTLRYDMDNETDLADEDYTDTIAYFGATYVFDDGDWPILSDQDIEPVSPGSTAGENCEEGQPCIDESSSVEAGGVALADLPANTIFAVQFDLNSSILDSEGQAELTKVSDLLLADESLKAVITGHADTQDGDTKTYNLWLSDKRAFKVHNFLVDLGIYAGRMEFRGYGDKVPKVVNLTEDHRSKNRRVEIHLYR